MEASRPMWGHHCTGDVNLIELGSAAIGWDEMGDLSRLEPTFEAFKDALRTAYPEFKPGAIPVSAGQLFRFVHEAKDGDYVVYREKHGGPIHIGLLKGDYFFEGDGAYPQRRRVTWLKTELPPTQFSPGALYELGASLSWFRVKTHAHEYLAAAEGREIPEEVQVPDQDEPDADRVEQATKDFVRKRLATEFKGHALTDLVASLLAVLGYRTIISPPGPDRGVDILAHRGPLGVEPPIVKVQVKSSEGGVGAPTVAELLGRLGGQGDAGLFVTLGHYTPDAARMGQDRSNLRLIDGSEFVDLLLENYERLSDEHRQKFPLRRVFAQVRPLEAEQSGEA